MLLCFSTAHSLYVSVWRVGRLRMPCCSARLLRLLLYSFSYVKNRGYFCLHSSICTEISPPECQASHSHELPISRSSFLHPNLQLSHSHLTPAVFVTHCSVLTRAISYTYTGTQSQRRSATCMEFIRPETSSSRPRSSARPRNTSRTNSSARRCSLLAFLCFRVAWVHVHTTCVCAYKCR
jgi:hypothetical protein